jgi:hypothetical protein
LFSEHRAETNKEMKLRDFNYWTENSKFRFPEWLKKTRSMQKLMIQFNEFPNCEHDDGLDACEGLASHARTPIRMMVKGK